MASPPSNSKDSGASQDTGASSNPVAIDHILRIARRNVRLIAICVVLVPLAALVYSATVEPRYAATASLLFRDPGFDDTLFGEALFAEDPDEDRLAATNLKLVSLRGIAERTARTLNRPELDPQTIQSRVSVAPDGTSDLVKVTAEDPDPKLAAALANTFATEYIEFRRDADRAKIGEAQELVQAQLDSLDATEQAGTDGQELEERARELEILASLQTGNAELVQPARPPADPSYPKTLRNLALAILLGLVLAAALTYLREQLDRRLRDPDEVGQAFDLPVLAEIPESSAVAAMAPVDGDAPGGQEDEAFRLLRTNLRYFNVDRDIASILVTSASPQDGKTTVSWNLARSEARSGNRVLYLEADLRRPTLQAQLHAAQQPEAGLSLVLAGMMPIEKAITRADGVDVVFAGPAPPNPAELIESDRMRDVLRWGSEHYDRVVVDTPPATVVPDAIPLVRLVDGVVIVVRIQRSRRDAVQALRQQLRNVGAPLLGLVVNGTAARRNSYSYEQQSYDGRLFREAQARARKVQRQPRRRDDQRNAQNNRDRVAQSGTQSDRPTSKQSDRPTSKQSDRPTSKQSDRPTSKQSDRPTSKQSDGPTSKQSGAKRKS